MKRRIQKWGNSLAIRIPKPFAADSKIEQGSVVEVSVKRGQIVVKPLRPPRLSLKTLLARVTSKNVHREVETGPALGREAW